MKFNFFCWLCIYTCLWIGPVRANPFKKVLFDTTKDLLESTKDNLKKPETYNKYIRRAVNGDFSGATDDMFNDLTSEFTQEKVTKGLFKNMIKAIAPMALGPVELIWSAGDLAKDYTQYMLGWMEGQIKKDFVNNVLNRYNTSAGVRQEFFDYMENRFDLLRGIPPTRRASLKQELEQAYHKRYIYLKKKELAKQAELQAKREVERRLRIAVGKAKRELREAQLKLKEAREKITEDSLKKFLHDEKYRQTVLAKAQKNREKIQQGKMSVPEVSEEEEGAFAVEQIIILKKISETKKKSLPFSHNDLIAQVKSCQQRLDAGALSYSDFINLIRQLEIASQERRDRCVHQASASKKKKTRASNNKRCVNGYETFMKNYLVVKEQVEKKVAQISKQYAAFKKPDSLEIHQEYRKYQKKYQQIDKLYKQNIVVRAGKNSWGIGKDLPDKITEWTPIKYGHLPLMHLRKITKGLEEYLSNIKKAKELSKEYEEKLEKLAQRSDNEIGKFNYEVSQFCQSNLMFISSANGDLERCLRLKQDNKTVLQMFDKVANTYSASEDFRVELDKVIRKIENYHKYMRNAVLSNDDFLVFYKKELDLHKEWLPLEVDSALYPVLSQAQYVGISSKKNGAKIINQLISQRKIVGAQKFGKIFLKKFFVNYVREFILMNRDSIVRSDLKSNCKDYQYYGVKSKCSMDSLRTIEDHKMILKRLQLYKKQLDRWRLADRLTNLSKSVKRYEKNILSVTYFSAEVSEAAQYFNAVKSSLNGVEEIIHKSDMKDLLHGELNLNLASYSRLVNDYSAFIKEDEARIDTLVKIFKKYQKVAGVKIGQLPEDFIAAESDEVWQHILRCKESSELVARVREIFSGNALAKFRAKDKKAIKDFYNEFKRAYERKREGKILSMVASDWSAADGEITTDELEDNLLRTFDVFDRLQFQYKIHEIKQVENSRRYKVRYSLQIRSKIYDRSLKHREKSSVIDLVEVSGEDSPRVKILKTLHGSLWIID